MTLDIMLDVFLTLVPYLLLVLLLIIFKRLFLWAKNRKTGAYLFGVLTQMFMPDPFVERTIEVVQEDKKKAREEEDENGEPIDKQSIIG